MALPSFIFHALSIVRADSELFPQISVKIIEIVESEIARTFSAI